MFSDVYFNLLHALAKKQYLGIPTLEHFQSDQIAQSYGALAKWCYEQETDSKIGLFLGRHLSPLNACDFSRLVTSASTVAEFLRSLCDHYHRLGLKPYPTLNTGNNEISVALSFPYFTPSDTGERFCAETFFSYCMNTIRLLTDGDVKACQIHLAFPDPGYGSEYENVFGCTIQFDSVVSMLVIPLTLGEQPLKSHAPDLHEIYLTKEQLYWVQAKRMQSFRYRTATLMMQLAPEGFQLEMIADQLHISPRGLQKRLKSEGVSFSEIVVQVRKALLVICQYQMEFSEAKTAEYLGFTTLAGFRRFKNLN